MLCDGLGDRYVPGVDSVNMLPGVELWSRVVGLPRIPEWAVRSHDGVEWPGRSYRRLHKRRGAREANLWLGDLVREVDRHPLRLVSDDDDIRAKAMRIARHCRELSLEGARARAEAFCIKPPAAASLVGERKRLCCRRWWARKLTALHARLVDQVGRELGFVSRVRQIYVSDPAHRLFVERRRRNRALLELTEAVNEVGDRYTRANNDKLTTP